MEMDRFASGEGEKGVEFELSLKPPQALINGGNEMNDVFGWKDCVSLELSLVCGSRLCTGTKMDGLIPDANIIMQSQEEELDLTLSLSSGPPKSVITSSVSCSAKVQVVDEGSTSGKWNVTHLGTPLSVTYVTCSNVSTQMISMSSMVEAVQIQKLQNANARICQVVGCRRGARGGSGHCISHGGGRRCERLGCLKGAEGRTIFCKAHGGGRRCEYLGCTKAAEGKTDFCIAHGGGRRCIHHGCSHASRGKSGLCIRHGGGKRCQKENCTKSAEGSLAFCITHGGGRRCQKPECTKGAQGSTLFCKAHGGGRRCTAVSCTKGAEGSTQLCKGHGGGKRCSYKGDNVCSKSVHGGTLFCVRHGGGKRCATLNCTKSARGRTSHCVRHGGGKRCQHEGCTKSAQGVTDFCKAHGGGKLAAIRGTLFKDKRVHGGGLLGPKLPNLETSPYKSINQTHERCSAEDICQSVSGFESQQGLKHFAPECNVPASISDLSSYRVPERRVHGGNILKLISTTGNYEKPPLC